MDRTILPFPIPENMPRYSGKYLVPEKVILSLMLFAKLKLQTLPIYIIILIVNGVDNHRMGGI